MKPELSLLVFAISIYLSLRGFASATLAPCIKVDDCSCRITTDEGEHEINIRSLGLEDQNQAPRFGFKQYNPSEPWEYAYNPCYAWSDGTANCQDVVVCQRSSTRHNDTFGLGDAAANWTDDGTHYYIVHSHTTRTTFIELRCDASATTPKFDYYKDQSNEYTFTLTSACACPGVCEASPTVKPLPNPPGTLSVGSVLCIIVLVVVVVYLVGGVMYKKFVRKAEGMEVIPNREIWTGLFINIRDGCVFIFSCGRRSGVPYARAGQQTIEYREL